MIADASSMAVMGAMLLPQLSVPVVMASADESSGAVPYAARSICLGGQSRSSAEGALDGRALRVSRPITAAQQHGELCALRISQRRRLIDQPLDVVLGAAGAILLSRFGEGAARFEEFGIVGAAVAAQCGDAGPVMLPRQGTKPAFLLQARLLSLVGACLRRHHQRYSS